MRQLSQWWDAIWFRRVDPLPGAMLRIFVGGLLFCWFLALGPNWERFYALDGIASWSDPDIAAQKSRSYINIFDLGDGVIPLRLYWVLGLAGSLAFTLGWKTRAAAIALFALLHSMIHRNAYVANGEELVIRMLLLYACFAKLGACLSIDAWLQAKKNGPPTEPVLVSAWPLRMMQVNVSLIYLISVPYKLAQDPAWLNGDALHWTLASDMWWTQGMFPEVTLWFGGWLRKLLSWSVLVGEFTFPLFVCLPRTRRYAIAFVTALHISIALLIPNVTYFTLSMVCAFWVFMTADDVRLLGASLRSAFLRWKAALSFSKGERFEQQSAAG